MVVYNIPTWINLSYLGGVAVVAMVRGGPSEKLLGLVQAFSLLNRTQGSPLDVPTWLELTACLVTSLYVTARIPRYWPIIAAASYLLALATWAIYALHPAIHIWSFFSARLTWLYLGATATLWGVATRGRDSAAPSKDE